MSNLPTQDATRRATPWLVLAIALLLAVLSAIYVGASAREADRLRFERFAELDMNLIERRIDLYLALLRGGSSHVAVTRTVTEERWSEYVAALGLEAHYPGIQGFGWAARVPDDSAFEAAMQEEHPGFRIWPAPAPPLRTTIAYLEPLDRRNQAAIGFDMATDDSRREAMERAWRSGQPAASGRVTLVQEIDPAKQAGFLIYAPVYVPPLPSNWPQRERQLRGFVYAPFRADDLFEAVLGERGRPFLSVAIYDGTEVRPEALLYRDEPAIGHTPELVGTRALEIAGRTWTVELASGPRFEAMSGRRLRFPVLAGGIAIGLLLFGITASMARSREEAERSAAEARSAARAREESERRFRGLVEQSPLSTQILTPDGHVLLANRAWEQLWGLTVEELGPWCIFDDPQLEAHGITPLLREVFAGEARALPTIPYTPPNGAFVGRPRHVRAFAYPVKDEDGRVQQVVLVHEDVTDRVRAEQALRQAQKLESAGVLAAGVAHEFNNLLTTIAGYTTLAARSVDSEETRGLLRHVLDASSRAADLVRQLLAYVGEGQVAVRRIDLAEAVREIEDLLRASVSRTAILTLDLPHEPLPVEGDPRQLQQALSNLVANAGEAIVDKVGRVEVVARHARLDQPEIGTVWAGTNLRPGSYVEIVVRDDGVGMDAAMRERIFDPFFTTKFLGRGLGLAAVLGIVRSHGGAIRVESEPGAGSTFTVVLPSPG